jgi:cytochrome P450
MTYADTITVEALERDPYAIYARMRRESPVAYVPAANIWFVTKWQDVETVAKSPDLFGAEVPTSPVERSFGSPTILTRDGPAHKELRDGIEPHYRARKVANYIEALVRPLAEAQIATFAGAGQAELMADYFEPISALALARSLGLGDVDVHTLRRWFHGLSQGAINFEQDPERQVISDATCAEVDAAVAPLLERLAKAPDGSPLSHLLHHGMPEGECRPLERILPTIKVTLLGGMQEPGHGAGSVLVGLLQSPEQMRAVRADLDGLLPKAVNEGLRWVAPIGTQTRNARTEVELGGARIPAGAPVAAVLASACHDEEHFTDPGRFDVYRNEGSHAAFGFGHHFCAGRWFSTAQMEIALRVLLERLPGLRLDPAHKVEFRGWEFRAPTALNVFF